LILGGNALAQTRDIALTAGVYKPLYQNIGGDLALTASYAQFSSTGLGFRTGVQYVTSVANVDNVLGLPVAVAWRSASRTASERLNSGAAGVSGTMRGYGYSSLEGAAGSLFASFLMGLFSDVEFYAGVTPAWTGGSSSSVSTASWGSGGDRRWTEKRSPLSLTLDAGMCINYRIWRFDLKLMPAFHFDPFGALSRHSETYHTSSVTTVDMPLHWFFSFSGGLAFRF